MSPLKSVVEYFRRLTEGGENPSLHTVLHQLSDYFDAKAVGIGAIDGRAISTFPVDDPVELPWQSDATLLQHLRSAFPAHLHANDRSHWLISVVSDTDIVWARRARGNWSEEEKWIWQLASQALVRWRTRSCPPAQRLEDAARVAGRLTHDFSNYLTGIMGFTELSLAHAPPESLLHRYLTEVLQAARDGAAWVHRLHLFCRRTPTRCWPTVLSGVVAEQEGRLRSSGASVHWVSDVPADLPLIDMDAGALQVILTELVNNVTETEQEGISITCKARVQETTDTDAVAVVGGAMPGGPHVELTLADDGPGIPLDDRDKLFRELFHSTKPRHRGLGLLVVYGILQRFGGGLRIAAGDGAGTKVHLYLPVALPHPARAAKGAARHLLVVHPDPLLRESLQRVLEASGFRVTATDSALAALGALAEADPAIALVVTDLKLAQMSGLDLARRVLEQDATTKFVFLHTQSSFQGMGEEELLKRFRVLRWPLEPQAFLDAIASALKPAKGNTTNQL